VTSSITSLGNSQGVWSGPGDDGNKKSRGPDS
jgi:hypothetical protein